MGSEMCIRDSVCSAAHHLVALRCVILRLQQQPAEKQHSNTNILSCKPQPRPPLASLLSLYFDDVIALADDHRRRRNTNISQHLQHDVSHR